MPPGRGGELWKDRRRRRETASDKEQIGLITRAQCDFILPSLRRSGCSQTPEAMSRRLFPDGNCEAKTAFGILKKEGVDVRASSAKKIKGVSP